MSDLFIQNENIRESIKKDVFPEPVLHTQNIKVKHTQSPIYKEEPAEYDNHFEYEKEHTSDTQSHGYTYFNNIDQLVKEFEHCNDNDITKKLTIKLCGYYLNLENEFPFLQYMMFLDGGKWNFPNIPFQCATNIPADEDGQVSPMHVYFENLCTMHMLEYVEMNEGDDENGMKSMFKGYVSSSSLENTLYVFFDLSRFHIKQNKDKRVMWITIDEMLNGHQSLGFEILKDCYSIFYQERALYTIQNHKGEIMETPSIMFLCQWKDNRFANVYNEFEEDEKEDYGYISLIDERINHPVLGNFFFFSIHPFEYQSSVTKIRRFVGHTKQPLYIMRPLSELQTKEIEPRYTLSDVIPSMVSYFSYPATNDQSEIQSDNATNDNLDKPNDESFQETDELIQPKTEEQTSVLETNVQQPLEDEVNSIASLDASCIYFQEYNEGTKVPFWCIKNSDDFVEL